jgi:hypothetical protein
VYCFCTSIEAFKSGAMFKKLWFGEYIVPVWNTQNLEDVLEQMDYPFAKTQSDKGKLYKDFFSPKKGQDDVAFLELFMKSCEKNKNTNMDVLLKYLLDKNNK